MGRIIIFTGKGGVGKTSVAAAHAIKSAAEGKKTLLVSTDLAHNLSDIFEQKIGRNGTAISDYLDALELDPDDLMQKEFSDLTRAVKKLLQSPGIDVPEEDIMSLIPGMDELFSLLKLYDLEQSGNYERIIVDCAPTGETLALLKFPELLSWYMEKFFPLGKLAVRVLAPVSRRFFQIELPDKAAMTDIERFYLKLLKLQELLKNENITSVRLVTLPEKMVVEETKRSYMYLNLFGYLVDGIYINRILPEEAGNDFFTDWFQIQRRYIGELEQTFDGIPVIKLPWYDTDICGQEAVSRLCKDSLNNNQLFDINSKPAGESYEQTEHGYQLHLCLPVVKKEEIDLHRSNTDLMIKIGNFKRNLPLPAALRSYEITSAKLENHILKVQFEPSAE